MTHHLNLSRLILKHLNMPTVKTRILKTQNYRSKKRKNKTNLNNFLLYLAYPFKSRNKFEFTHLYYNGIKTF